MTSLFLPVSFLPQPPIIWILFPKDHILPRSTMMSKLLSWLNIYIIIFVTHISAAFHPTDHFLFENSLCPVPIISLLYILVISQSSLLALLLPAISWMFVFSGIPSLASLLNLLFQDDHFTPMSDHSQTAKYLTPTSLLNPYTCVHVYMCVFIYTCIHIHIYIYI